MKQNYCSKYRTQGYNQLSWAISLVCLCDYVHHTQTYHVHHHPQPPPLRVSVKLNSKITTNSLQPCSIITLIKLDQKHEFLLLPLRFCSHLVPMGPVPKDTTLWALI